VREQRSLWWLLVANGLVVLVPGAIVAASRIVLAANETAGFQRHTIPAVLFSAFIAGGLASPVVGLGSLLALWARKPARSGVRTALILAAVVAVLAPAEWFMVLAEVFFAAGGTR
jgi:hypothetical protein